MLKAQQSALDTTEGNPFEYFAKDDDIDATCPPELIIDADEEVEENAILDIEN